MCLAHWRALPLRLRRAHHNAWREFKPHIGDCKTEADLARCPDAGLVLALYETHCKAAEACLVAALEEGVVVEQQPSTIEADLRELGLV